MGPGSTSPRPRRRLREGGFKRCLRRASSVLCSTISAPRTFKSTSGTPNKLGLLHVWRQRNAKTLPPSKLVACSAARPPGGASSGPARTCTTARPSRNCCAESQACAWSCRSSIGLCAGARTIAVSCAAWARREAGGSTRTRTLPPPWRRTTSGSAPTRRAGCSGSGAAAPEAAARAARRRVEAGGPPAGCEYTSVRGVKTQARGV